MVNNIVEKFMREQIDFYFEELVATGTSLYILTVIQGPYNQIRVCFSYPSQFLCDLCKLFGIDYLKDKIAIIKACDVLIPTNSMQGRYCSHLTHEKIKIESLSYLLKITQQVNYKWGFEQSGVLNPKHRLKKGQCMYISRFLELPTFADLIYQENIFHSNIETLGVCCL